MTKEIECKLPCIKHHHGRDEKQTVFGHGPTREKALSEAMEIARRYGMKPDGEAQAAYSDDDISAQPLAEQLPSTAGSTINSPEDKTGHVTWRPRNSKFQVSMRGEVLKEDYLLAQLAIAPNRNVDAALWCMYGSPEVPHTGTGKWSVEDTGLWSYNYQPGSDDGTVLIRAIGDETPMVTKRMASPWVYAPAPYFTISIDDALKLAIEQHGPQNAAKMFAHAYAEAVVEDDVGDSWFKIMPRRLCIRIVTGKID